MIVHPIIDPTFWGDLRVWIEGGLTSPDWFPGFFIAGSGTHFRIFWNQKATQKLGQKKRTGMVRSRWFFDQITWKLMIIMVTDPSEIEWMIWGKFIHSRHSKSRTIIEKKHKKTLTYIRPVLTQFKKQEPKFMFIHFPIDIQSHILRIPRCFRIPQFRWIPGSPKFNMLTAIIPKRTFFFHTVDGSEIRRSPVEVGSLYHYLQGSSTSQPGGFQRWISEPSTVPLPLPLVDF